MICRVIVLLLCCASALAAKSSNAPGARKLNMKSQVLDVLFPLEVEPSPYYAKMVLRFGDSNSQIVVVTYPGGKTEILTYQLSDTNGDTLDSIVENEIRRAPQVKAEAIASRLKVDVHRYPIDREFVVRATDALKKIRISPALETRVAVDEFSEFEFWYDTWQETVYYSIITPSRGEARDELVQWMRTFRDDVRTRTRIVK